MGGKGRSGRKKKKTHANVKKTGVDLEPAELTRAPHSFVFHRGTVGDAIVDLTRDFRKIMEPFTATSLKARRANSIKDFLSVAGVLHVSHITIFTATDIGTYMKIAKVPQGPTLYFRVINYCLARDVISSLKKQFVFQKLFEQPPLVILNNFKESGIHIKLMASMFQNMFPAINLAKVNLNNVKRCVLFNYRSDVEEIDVRHYSVKVVPVGVSKGVKKIVQSKVPNLSRFEDISEFITKAQLLSESEAEDDPASHVTLPQEISSRGNMNSAQSSIRLIEQGPRLTLQLIKIEDGFMAGEVLYHRHIVKSDEEKSILLKKRIEKRQMKEERKRIQAEMVRRKELEKEAHKIKSLQGMKKKQIDMEGVTQEDDDDAAWFKAEVGKEPEHDLFDKKSKNVAIKRRRTPQGEGPSSKKAKVTRSFRTQKDKKNNLKSGSGVKNNLNRRKKSK